MPERIRFERELSDLELQPLTPARELRDREARTSQSGKLPLLLAGPIVRRATPDAVWFWFACSKEVKGCTPSITAYSSNGKVNLKWVDPQLKEIILQVGDLRKVRLGENLWIVLVSAVPKSGKFPTDVILGYELSIAFEDKGVAKTTKLAGLDLKITYPPFPRPTFVLGLENRRLAHGSCRRPGADAKDAFAYFDEWLSKNVSDPIARPASLILTGDQIYADDVAVPLFEAVRRLALDVFGYVEQLPELTGSNFRSADNYSWQDTRPQPGAGAGSRAPTSQDWSERHKLTHLSTSPIGFTTDDGEAHLLSLPEYAAMYLIVWNPELCDAYDVERFSARELRGFCRATQLCRRVMANTATYMLCDDHEITDDWNLDQDWEDKTKKNSLARRIISNGLAAYWGFQAWGNDPDTFDQSFIQAIVLYAEQLRNNNGIPRNVGSRSSYNAGAKYDDVLLNAHWSFVAPSNPKALCIDTRTRRETPKGKSAILSGKRVWSILDGLIKRYQFQKGDPLLLVTPTPFLPHRSMMFIQRKKYSFPKERYQGDFELYGNNPQQRAELVLWLHDRLNPPAVVFFSGDVHHGSVVSGRYAHGATLDKVRNGKGDWAIRIVQVTSSPIKNEKNAAYRDKIAKITDAGNIGESVIRQWEHQYASINDGTYIAALATVNKLSGNLGRETYIFEPHLCVVDMPAQPKGDVKVLFVGEKDGKMQTAATKVDTDNDPSKFLYLKAGGLAFPVIVK